DRAVFNIDDPRVLSFYLQRKNDADLATTARGLEEFPNVNWLDGWGGAAEGYQYLAAVWRDGEARNGLSKPLIGFRISDFALQGAHNRANVAAALGAILEVVNPGAHAEKIAAVIREFESLPHRLEVVSRAGGVNWVNDSQATIPDATIAALQAFAPPVILIA